MSATHASAVTATMFQLLQALDGYADQTRHLAAPGVAPEAYHRLRVQLDEMRRYALAVPGLSVVWVELLIRHFELAHARWKVEQGEGDLDGIAAVLAQHQAALGAMRKQCVALLTEQHGPSPR